MTFTFDTGPRILLAIGALLLVLALVAFVTGSSFAMIGLGMAVLFLVVALAAAYSPKK